MKKIKSSLFNRAPKLLSASLKLALGRDIDSVVQNLSEMKGVPQKIGQLLSMDVSQYVSAELKEKLKPLQGSSQALNSDVMLNILKLSIGNEQFEKISQFGSTALGAGSIGQVHRAMITAEKREVVFKIQYPNIEDSIHSDMAVLNPFSSIYEFIRPESKDLSILLKEAKAMLLSEIDYELESQNLEFFKKVLSGDDRFHVPGFIKNYSSQNVICMDYIEGQSLNDFVSGNGSSIAKTKVASAMLDLFISEFFLYGRVQTDPNFANYLVGENEKIILLDFGAVKVFEKEFRTQYFNLLSASYDQDDYKILIYGEALGLVDRADTKLAVQLFVGFMKDVMSYFHQEKNPMDFKNEEITKKLMEAGWKLWKEQRISRPNSNLVFLHRKLGGLFSLLKEMQIQIDLYPFWEKIQTLNRLQ